MKNPLLFISSATALLFISSAGLAVPQASADNSLSLTAGLGLTDFQDGAMRRVTKPGLGWNVRLGIGTDSFLGAEVAYIGTAQSAEVFSDVTLVSHGLEGLARVNFTPGLIQPYAVAGLGWAHYKVYVDEEGFNIPTDDDILNVPVGGGLAVHLSAITVDFRAVYRIAFDDEVFSESAEFEGNSNLDRWEVTASAGIRF